MSGAVPADNTSEDKDLEKVLASCRDRLPPPTQWSAFAGYPNSLRRWVVERSLGWLMLHRRLSRDYETLPASSEAMIHVASIDNLTKRITDETTPTWRGTY